MSANPVYGRYLNAQMKNDILNVNVFPNINTHAHTYAYSLCNDKKTAQYTKHHHHHHHHYMGGRAKNGKQAKHKERKRANQCHAMPFKQEAKSGAEKPHLK